MSFTEVQKVLFGTYMLSKEVGYWCGKLSQGMEVTGIDITWTTFRANF